ncbi:MAG: ABC transporter substrate-binding protein [Bacteroides sp.]|nr:ABC transporter substrate-binding protein [Bacteroides sp.]
MKNLFLTIILLSAASLSSCVGRQSAAHSVGGDTISLRYASNLKMVEYADFTKVILRNPWDTVQTLGTYLLVEASAPLPANLPEGVVVRTPLSNALFYSSVHCSLLHRLGGLHRIGGVCDLKYLNIEEIHKAVEEGRVKDCGDALNPDIEAVIDLHPDAILLSPFENSGGYGRVEKLNIPIIACADYMETSPLGRAEWMRFYGRLVGAEADADSLFSQIEANYLALKRQASNSESRLSVLPDLKTASTWYMPGGRSYIGRLYSDAHIDYAFAADTHSGSVPLSFESVFDKAGEADIWLIRYNHPSHDMTYRDLEKEFVGYTALKAFKQRKVYGCNTAKVPYYEEAPFRPDYLLGDYIKIFHPELELSDSLRYFCPLKE